MKYILLNAILFLLVISCNKPTNTTPINTNPITGNWVLTLDNSVQPMKGSTSTCEMENLNVNTPKNYLVMQGWSTVPSDYVILFWIKMPSIQPVSGHFSLTDSGNLITLGKYSTPVLYFEYVASLNYPKSSMSFDLVYNSTTKAVSATFSGTFDDHFGSIHTITNGTINGLLK